MNNSSTNEAWMDRIAAATIACLSLPALAVYILVVIVIANNPQKFANNSYYTLLLSLALSDSILLSLYCFYAVPCTLIQENIFGANFDIFIGVVFNIAYFSCLPCIAAIGVNRYFAVCQFVSYDSTFNRRNTRIVLAIVWAIGIIFGSGQAFPCCTLRFSYYNYSFAYDMTNWGNVYFQWFDRFLTVCSFFVIFFCYVAIIVKRPTKFGSTENRLNTLQQTKRKNVERNLALQFGVIVLMLIFAGLSFTIVPELTANRWFMLVASVLYIVNNGCGPFVYLIFNSTIRSHFLQLYCRSTIEADGKPAGLMKLGAAVKIINTARRLSNKDNNKVKELRASRKNTTLTRRETVIR
uniref:G-protein coupled receptors family 1 profile domain-containing protein n=1 Tax=Plectus sambesii TaxID=2011161 RepID=A0A914X0E8_9BILA